jgi:hypothetical protein
MGPLVEKIKARFVPARAAQEEQETA